MTKKSDGYLAKFTFLLVEDYFGRLDSVEGCCKVDTMLLLIFAIDKDVVHEANYTWEAFDDLAHASLKVLWSTRYAKWHLVETKPTKGCDEGGQQVGPLGNGICQNPLLASSLLKILAPASCASMSYTFGSGWVS